MRKNIYQPEIQINPKETSFTYSQNVQKQSRLPERAACFCYIVLTTKILLY